MKPFASGYSFDSKLPSISGEMTLPPWQGRSIAGPKLRLVEFSAFLEHQRDPDSVSERQMFYRSFLLPGTSGREIVNMKVRNMKSTHYCNRKMKNNCSFADMYQSFLLNILVSAFVYSLLVESKNLQLFYA